VRSGLVLLLVVTACGHPHDGGVPARSSRGPGRLLPPAVIDPARPAAGFLTTVALQLQPGWSQFLEDCRLRLPANHPLNRMALEATSELVLDRRGTVLAVELVSSSGNSDFDRAVKDAISDATHLPVPPIEALSDDDRVYLRWVFARDRRQAGPATATVEQHELPLREAIERIVESGDLGRAARRIRRAPARDPDRVAATTVVATAALREALASLDSAAQRAAVEAIGTATVTDLAPQARALLESASDELRIMAMTTAAALGDRATVESIARQLRRDVAEHRRLALAETSALVRLGAAPEAEDAVARALATGPSPIALEAFALVPRATLMPQLATWLGHGKAATRTAVCAAVTGVTLPAAVELVALGLRDADATVRASCAAAAAETAGHDRTLLARSRAELVVLQRDRDRAVRASAMRAVALVDPSHLDRGSEDPAAEVREVYARTSIDLVELRTLADDRDADVRAAAWHSLAALHAPPDAAAGLADPAPQVRLAAVGASHDDVTLRRLAASDDAPEVRTAALVRLTQQLGRTGMADILLEQLAAAQPASADRVRIAHAWLLAP
jgi:TonB family protein